MAKKAKRRTQQRFRPPRPDQQPSGECSDESPSPAVESAPGEHRNGDGLELEQAVKCRHFTRGVDVEKLGEKLREAASQHCLDCSKKQPKDGKKKPVNRKKNQQENEDSSSLWFCLACAHVGCAKSVEETSSAVQLPLGHGHAIEHFRRNRHPFVLQCGDASSIWCLDCQGSIATQASIIDGFPGLGARGKLLQQAVRLIQESSMSESDGAGKGKEENESVSATRSATSTSVECSSPKNGIVRGLVNLGNTCFFNSVMQNLLAVRYLKDYFLNPVAGGASEGPLTSALRRFFLEINGDNLEAFSGNAKKRHRDYTTYNPKGLFGALCSKSSRFSGYHQQDSHELLRCLLDGLQVEGKHKESEEKNSTNGKEDHTFVDHLFGGQFASTVTCCECGHSSSVLEPFLDVSLPIPLSHSSKGTTSTFKVASKVQTNNACSKREAKAKKALERKRKVLQPKASFQIKCEKNIGEKISETAVEKQAETGSVMDDLSWLDYVGDDFVDVTSQQQFSDHDENRLEVTVAEEGGSELRDEGKAVAEVDATTSGPLGGEGKEADNADSIVGEGVTTIAALPGKEEEDLSKVGKEEDDLSKVADVTITGVEDSVDNSEGLPSAGPPAVILLPYWEGDNQASSNVQDGWEMLAPSEVDGIADLFFEEEASTSVTVLGCAERPGTSSTNAASVEETEEIEDIIEKSITAKSLEGCLQAFTKLEVLSGENAWGCDNCTRRSCDSADSTIVDGDEDGPTCDAEARGTEPTSSQAGPCSMEEKGEDEDGNDTSCGKPKTKQAHKGGSSSRSSSSTKVLVKRKATKRLVIRKAPPVLTVHLKRFAQDMRGRLSKLTGHVAFDELLNLSPFLSASRDGGLYRLVGVVEHSGTMKGGHYVAFVRGGSAGDGKENFWYYISDSDVRRTTLDQVLRSEAYLLFYERV
ncbi:ubiquitin carboxyl-terminal hydrolase 1 [Selaginella moellendorffii]|uniref:ubiquitin carboxyl-terminal hydrolase 1 n=1 Tax=Selaginella moellendorffii TaxID=88036 RepID=UPI000D1CD948|nr:ubiquitin carboxyl-terminal hydrolase 1 [Selaginella moellendorffii]|eukprot:XP_024521247.1 ubiquitin carboxyl-terminal hydrolase 1 [Selaginella moellendorffii]